MYLQASSFPDPIPRFGNETTALDCFLQARFRLSFTVADCGILYAIYDVSQVEMECTDSDEDKPEEKQDEQVWWHQFACLCGSGRKS